MFGANAQALRDATLGMLEEVKEQMSDVVYRRARHCVGEDQRTLATVQALKENDYQKVGTYTILSE
jgi:galactokinase